MSFTYLFMVILISMTVSLLNANEIVTSMKCQSTIGFTSFKWQFTPSYCRIPDVSADASVNISLKEDGYPFKCKLNNAFELKSYADSNTIYIVARNGCNGLFEITQTIAEVRNSPQCGLPNRPRGFRIVNGNQSNVECHYPWMALVHNNVARKFCGGSILDERHILTAAHCVVRPGSNDTIYPVYNFYIYTGSNKIPIRTLNIKGLRERYAKEIFVHEGYRGISLVNDIAVIKLTSNIKYDNCHRPVCLVNTTTEVENARNCRVIGWGYASVDPRIATVQETIRWANQKPASSKACAAAYNKRYSSNVFCAKGVGNDASDACTGDSGGPFVCREDDGSSFYQHGIVSAGKSGQKCGDGYGLYTNVNRYVDWISATLKK